MLIDIALKSPPKKMVKNAQGNEQKALVRHLGTTFDVMDKEFPLEYTKRQGIDFAGVRRGKEHTPKDQHPMIVVPALYCAGRIRSFVAD